MKSLLKVCTLLLAFAALLPAAAKAQNIATVGTQQELEQAIADSNYGEARINKDITFTSAVEIPVAYTIISNQESTSTVKKYTISGDNKTSLFDIKVASSTLSNLTLTKGAGTKTSDTVTGGAISIVAPNAPTGLASSVTLSGIAFENNISSITAAGDVKALGGAIHSDSTHNVVVVNSSFKGNVASATSSTGSSADAFGGAIYNIGSGTFVISSTTFSENSAGSGGAVFSTGKMELGNLTFNKNTATVDGGALYLLGNTKGNGLTFTANTAEGNGGAIVNKTTSELQNLTFDKNTAGNRGGAVYNEAVLTLTTANFTNNSSTAEGGAVFNSNKLTLGGSVNFSGNKAEANGGALFNTGSISAAVVNFNNNTSTANGGAIYTSNSSGKGDITIKGGGLFQNNHSDGLGGAIYADNAKLNISASSGLVFQGNTDSTGNNAIHLAGTSTLNLNIGTEAAFYDKITGGAGSVIRINAPQSADSSIPAGAPTNGRLTLYTGIEGYTGSFGIYGGSLGLFADMTFNTSDFTLSNTNIDMMNGVINNITVAGGSYSQTGTSNVKLDIDAKNQVADTFNTPGGSTGTLNVTDIRILSDSTSQTTGSILISNNLDVVFDTSKTYYGPVFQYILSQNNTHSVILDKTENFTPSILGSSVVQNSAVFNNMIISNSIMNRVDVMLSRDGRYYGINNRYSLSKNDTFRNKKTFKMGGITQKDWYTTWFVPYGANQTFSFENGMDGVKNKSYGGNVGIDMPVIRMGDFGFIPTVFAGYGSATQKYKSLEASGDTGLFGIMATLYRENFFTSLEVHVTNGTQITRFDNYRDTFDMFTLTAASKTEATLPIYENLSLQPSIMFAYNLVNTQDYLTDLGAQMNSDKLHNFQILPGIKLMANISGWHPYLNASYAYNAVSSGKVVVEDIALPEFKGKDYLEYGIGLENTFLENYSGYFQISGYADGITGYSVQIGLRGYINN